MRALKAAGPWSAGLLLITVACNAMAHVPDQALDAGPGWTFDAWITVPLAASALLFATGWLRLRARLRPRLRSSTAPWRRRALWFAAGWGVVAAALVSPLHAAGERSFAAHMLEHELLMLLGAPLLVLARPLVVLLWALPAAWRRGIGALVASGPASRAWRRATGPFTATALQATALWLWHAPALFDLALAHAGWHAAQHVSFLVSALLFWTAVLPRTASAARGAAALCLFATSLVSGALGALMALSQSPWYQGYAQLPTAPFGLTPAEDQQLAGLLMWIPGGLLHAVVALVVVRGLLAGPASGAATGDAAAEVKANADASVSANATAGVDADGDAGVDAGVDADGDADGDGRTRARAGAGVGANVDPATRAHVDVHAA